MKRMTLRASMGLMLGMFALLVSLVGAGGFIALKQARQSFDTLNHLNVAQIGAAEQAYGALMGTRLQLNTYQTLYNRLKVKAAKASLTQAKASFAQAQRALKQLDADQADATAAALIAATRTAFAALIDKGITPTFDALKRWDMADYTKADAQANELTDRLDVVLAQLNEHAESAGADATAAMARNASWMRLGMPSALGLALVLMGLSYLAAQRGLFQPLKQAQRHFQRIAAGDLTASIASRHRNEMGQLFTSLAAMQDALHAMVLTVRQSSHELRDNAGALTSASGELAARTEQQAAAVQQTTASMEEMTVTVKHNAASAAQGQRLSTQAAQIIEHGSQQTREAIATMHDATAHSRQAFEIIAMIDEIAFQTNILALNASVEAARAGERGKGFAVVADEVRALSQRSTEAADDIRRLIEDTHERVNRGTLLIEAAGQAMNEAETASQRVTALLEAIAQASREQHAGIEQINRAIVQVDTTTQRNATMAQRSVEAAHALQHQSSRLEEHVARFTTEHGDSPAPADDASCASDSEAIATDDEPETASLRPTLSPASAAASQAHETAPI